MNRNSGVKNNTPKLANELGMVEKLTGKKISIFVIAYIADAPDDYLIELTASFLTEKAAKRWIRDLGRHMDEQYKKMYGKSRQQVLGLKNYANNYEIREVELTLE